MILALLILLLLPATSFAQQIVGANLATARYEWTFDQGSGGVPTQFRVRCGPAAGKYTRETPVPYAASPNSTYSVPISEITGNVPGTFFCVVLASNQVGDSTPSPEISFFAGTVPLAPSAPRVVAQ